MPVPDPDPGFVDRVLTRASAGELPRETRAPRGPLARPATWWAAAGGALAATLVWAVLFFARPEAPQQPNVVLALNESREVSLVIDSERDLENAIIRVYVMGSVGLEGYQDQQEIEWLTSLTQGANLLSLPVIGLSPGEGSVVAVIEHDGRTRRVSVAMQVLPRGDTA